MSEDPFASGLPRVVQVPPGPATRALAERLRAVESRNVTFLGEAFPVFWERARGALVEDADGNVLLDFTGAFGVAAAGHCHPRITAAIRDQAGRLPHAMGDVHPPARKVELLERLAGVLPWGEATRGVLATSGSEAVEVALKTALLATGRPGVVAFQGGYHGLTLGALAATAREDFRAPFRTRLYGGVRWVPFPEAASGSLPVGRRDGIAADPSRAAREDGIAADPPQAGREDGIASMEPALEALEGALAVEEGDAVGAVIVEPIQGRAGVRIPSEGFLAEVAVRARDAGALLVFDEVFTGFGRTGETFAFEHQGVIPDLICLGKALGGGLPLSACCGPARVMDAWPASSGEALHTSTFLGHPLACASAVAFLDVLREEELVEAARHRGRLLRERLADALEGAPGVRRVRGCGLFVGVELEGASAGARVAEAALQRGLLVLPAGGQGEVVELAPPLVISEAQIGEGVRLLAEAVREALPLSG